MAKALNFNNVKKQYLTVTLADEKKTLLMIGTPTKAIMDNLTDLQSTLETLSEDNTNAEAIADLYDVCAKVMSRNKGGIEITTDYLENLFDIEDVILFFNAYMDFIAEVANEKN